MAWTSARLFSPTPPAMAPATDDVREPADTLMTSTGPLLVANDAAGKGELMHLNSTGFSRARQDGVIAQSMLSPNSLGRANTSACVPTVFPRWSQDTRLPPY